MARNTLAIDFGSRYIGVALVRHTSQVPNEVLYAATVVVEPKLLKEPITNRSATRRMRRTRKTRRRRLAHLGQALGSIAGAAQIVKFCRRRGFSYEIEEVSAENGGFHVSRESFFQSLERYIAKVIPESDRARVLALCERHLNRKRLPEAELRPARFENRGRSRCKWEGCQNNVPRASNDVAGRLGQSLFSWLRPVFEEIGEPNRLQKSVEHWIGELSAIAKALQKPNLPDESKIRYNRRIKRIYGLLKDRVTKEASANVADRFRVNWTKTYRAIVSEIVRGQATGRVRFCREHSRQFVNFTIAGKDIPTQEELTERDLVSRTQQVIFARLARLIEGRLLPLAGGQIDRLVVERVAFDVLCGPFKELQKLSDEKATDLYRNGPQAGFKSRREMLQAEFGGICAYTGEPCNSFEEEHMFPQSQFPFDSYLNVVPASREANARKGGRTIFDAGMTIHPKAYEIYCDYLSRRKILHPYHNIKKGLLKLLTYPQTVNKAERLLATIASNLVEISHAQRSPRPLAKYLATRIEKRTAKRPSVEHRPGRHTALYRAILLPDYRKDEAKRAQDLKNHAVDAVLLGCELSPTSVLENLKRTATGAQVEQWMERTRGQSPRIKNGVPTVMDLQSIPFFEEDLGDGYRRIDLWAFNWNRARKAAHKTEPYGQTRTDDPQPIRRRSASTILADLRGKSKDRDKRIRLIANRDLRAQLSANREQSPRIFIEWLQSTIRGGLCQENGNLDHPCDEARITLLHRFINACVDEFLREESPEIIPRTIGVQCIEEDSKGQNTLHRRIDDNDTAQWYQDRSKAFILIGYRAKSGAVDRSRAVRIKVRADCRTFCGLMEMLS